MLRGLAKFFGPASVLVKPRDVDLSSFFSSEVLKTTNKPELAPILDLKLEESKAALIILNTAYSDGWIAESEGISLPHLISNGYSNAFFVDNPNMQTIKIYFSPQNFYQIGSIISIFTILTVLISLTIIRYNLKYMFKEFIKARFQ
jgi:hypothetical protein